MYCFNDFRIHIRLSGQKGARISSCVTNAPVFHEITEDVKALVRGGTLLVPRSKDMGHSVDPEWLENLHCPDQSLSLVGMQLSH